MNREPLQPYITAATHGVSPRHDTFFQPIVWCVKKGWHNFFAIGKAMKNLEIDLQDVVLEGDLNLPDNPRGIVLFAHGSGSSRKSPRNRFVASILNTAGFATLLFDLLTHDEEEADEYTAQFRFDIGMLADRLAETTEWVVAHYPEFQDRIGFFGASTGGAAAIVAAAEHPEDVFAVVSRGGRPDLAGKSLGHVRAPVLLIVGGDDTEVITLNQEAKKLIRAPCELTIVPGASHLFEESGALEQVASLAARWFSTHVPAREKPRQAGQEQPEARPDAP